MPINTAEINMVISLIQSLVAIIETYDANAATNPIIVKLQNAIAEIQALGL